MATPPGEPLVVTSNNVVIDAGANYELPLPITQPNTVVKFSFKLNTPGADIGFRISHVAGGKVTMLLPSARKKGGVRGAPPIEGGVKVSSPGTCALLWQNDHSWFKNKVISYTVEVIAPGQTSAFGGQPQQGLAGAARHRSKDVLAPPPPPPPPPPPAGTALTRHDSVEGVEFETVSASVPPGPLGLDLVGRTSRPGIKVRRVHPSSVLVAKVRPGALLMSVNGCDCSKMQREQITNLVQESAQQQRTLVFLSPLASPEPSRVVPAMATSSTAGALVPGPAAVAAAAAAAAGEDEEAGGPCTDEEEEGEEEAPAAADGQAEQQGTAAAEGAAPTSLQNTRPKVVLRHRPSGRALGSNDDDSVAVLEYLALRGLGEVPRLLLEVAGVDYDCVLYFHGGAGGGSGRVVSSVNPDWQARKGSTPFGKLPVYRGPELGGQAKGLQLAESSAIARHLARVHGLAGRGAEEQAHCDMLFEASKSVPLVRGGFLIESDFAATPSVEDCAATAAFLRALQSSLQPASGLFVGAGVTLADLAIFNTLETMDEARPGCLGAMGLLDLEAFRFKVRQLPRVAAYLASERRMPATSKELGAVGWETMPANGFVYRQPLPPAFGGGEDST